MNRQTDNDWQRVREIFDEALRHPFEERSAFVRTACEGDDGMRTEVESLLDSLNSAERFLETSAVVQVIDIHADNGLTPGEMLLHYEIRKLLGSGGMGDVYLARDTRLNRNVAIKLLRASFIPDVDAKRRLLREARAAALLEHSNICQIYEISETSDHSFIVMQYVVGPTLAEVLAKERISTRDAVDLAIQIVDGLAEAHRQGVIHRDIKPANVMVNEKRQAKILDFGLAKFIEAETRSETEQRLHSSGAVMGTVPYMSPEQLKGQRVDKRTDIFSVGSLLYEMFAARPAFSCDNSAETISAILKEEPDWSAVPPRIAPILKHCLAKEVDERYPTTDELLRDLRELQSSGIPDAESTGRTASIPNVHRTDGGPPKKRHLYFWQSADDHVESGDFAPVVEAGRPVFQNIRALGGAALVLALVATAGVWLWRWVDKESPRFDTLRAVRLVSWKSGASTSLTDFRISHNGKTVAYSSSELGEREAIYIKQTSGGEDIQVTKDEWTNVDPLWSPDDQRIAYVSVREDKPGIYMTPTFGGASTPLATTAGANISLRHWSRNADAIFYEQKGNLYRLEVSTGTITKLTQLPDTPNNTRYFSFSPDERSLVYSDVRDGQKDLWKIPVGGGDPVQITNDPNPELRPRWHPDGEYILYNVYLNGLAQIYQASANGAGAPVQLTRGDRGSLLIDISPEGDKLYYSDTESRSDVSSISVDSGRENEVAAEPDLEYWSAMSPDGRSLVYQVSPPNAKMFASAFVVRSSDDQKRELSAKGFDARWLPDSRQLQMFRLDETTGEYSAWLVDTVTGKERRITNEDVMTQAWTPLPIMRSHLSIIDFSPDGKRFVYVSSKAPQNAKIGLLDSEGVIDLTSNQNRNVTYTSPNFSPDGSSIALCSIEEFADKTQKPLRRIHIFKSGREHVVYTSTDVVRMVGWATNSTLILSTTDKGIPAFPLAVDIALVSLGGNSRKLFTLNDAYIRTITISPGGKEIAYVSAKAGRENIFIVPLIEGAEPKQISFSGSTRLFIANLVFSPDARTIFFDKQEEINTISLFESEK